MKYLLFILIFLIGCKNSTQEKTENIFNDKTYTASMGISCGKPIDPKPGDCYTDEEFLEISFEENKYVAKDFTVACGKSQINFTKKGTWKIKNNEIIFSPEIGELGGKLNFIFRDNSLFAKNEYREVKFSEK